MIMSIILVEAKHDYDNCIEQKIRSFETFDDFLKDPYISSCLKNNGFVNINEQEKIKSKIKTDGKLYICNAGLNSSPYYPTMREIGDKDDLKINHNEAEAFAKGEASILFGVSSASILDKKSLELIEDAKKSLRKKEIAAEKAKETKEKNSKKRAIEKAKRTLEKAGIPLDFMEKMNDK